MNFEEFIIELKKEVKKIVGSEYTVTVKCVLKVNRELQGLSIFQDGCTCSPSIYLEDYYTEYQEGRSIHAIAENIVLLSERWKRKPALITENLQDYLWVKSKLRVKLINYQKNKKLLLTVPHKRFLDLVSIPYIVLEEGKNIITTRVTNLLLEKWGVDEDTVMKQAEENTLTMNSVIVEKMSDYILKTIIKDNEEARGNVFDGEEEEMFRTLIGESTPGSEMYIMTNKNNMDGAYAAFRPDQLADLSDRTGYKKLFILPSSIHELIAVPVAGIEPSNLKEMVRSINQTEVQEEDYLSDSIYQYDRLDNKITIVL